MSNIEQLHSEAMDLAEEGFVARRNGNEKEADRKFLSALELEKKVASHFSPDEKSEPIRSIIYCSAASIAYHIKDYKQAKQLVTQGLSGYPHVEIKKALEAMLLLTNQSDISINKAKREQND